MDKVSKYFQNVGKLLADHMVLQPRRRPSSEQWMFRLATKVIVHFDSFVHECYITNCSTFCFGRRCDKSSENVLEKQHRSVLIIFNNWSKCTYVKSVVKYIQINISQRNFSSDWTKTRCFISMPFLMESLRGLKIVGNEWKIQLLVHSVVNLFVRNISAIQTFP